MTRRRPPVPVSLERVDRARRRRSAVANSITVLMLGGTLVMLAYIAWQLNHPITLYLSRVFGAR